MATQPEEQERSPSPILHSSASFCLEFESEQHTPYFQEWSSSDDSVGEQKLLRSDSDKILACSFESCPRPNYKKQSPSPLPDDCPVDPLLGQLPDTSVGLSKQNSGGLSGDEQDQLDIVTKALDRASTDNLSGYALSKTESSSNSSYNRVLTRQEPDLRMLKSARKTRTSKWVDEKSKPHRGPSASESTLKLPASTIRELPQQESRPLLSKQASTIDVNRSSRPAKHKREVSSQALLSPGISTTTNPVDYWHNSMTDFSEDVQLLPSTPGVYQQTAKRRGQSKSDFLGPDYIASTPVKEKPPAGRPSAFRSISQDIFPRKKGPRATIKAESPGSKTPNFTKYSRGTISTPSTISSSRSSSPGSDTPKPHKKKRFFLSRLRKRNDQRTPKASKQSHEEIHEDSHERPKKLMLAPTTMLPMPGVVSVHFLESEATKIITPQTSPIRAQSGYFDFNYKPHPGETSDSDKSWSRAIQTLPESPGYCLSYNDVHGPRTAPAAPTMTTPDWFRVQSDEYAVREDNDTLLEKFEWDVPEHLPNSPLCPLHPKHPSGGRGVCVYHGRRKSKFSEMAEASAPAKKSISWSKTEKLLGLGLA